MTVPWVGSNVTACAVRLWASSSTSIVPWACSGLGRQCHTRGDGGGRAGSGCERVVSCEPAPSVVTGLRTDSSAGSSDPEASPLSPLLSSALGHLEKDSEKVKTAGRFH